MKMMEIVQTKINLSPNLNNLERQIVLAQLSKRIRECNVDELTNVVNEAIVKAYFQCGQKPDTKTLVLEVKELLKDLTKYFPTIFLNEIELFFKQGIDGQLGEYYGLNLKTYRQWLRNGATNISRLNAMKIQRQFLESQNKPPELSEDDKEKIIEDGVFNLFEIFKNTGYVEDYNNVTYNWLDKRGYIPFSKERKIEIKEQAIKVVKARLQDALLTAKAKREKEGAKAIRIELDNFLKSDKIIYEAKKIALNIFFKELIETDTTLEDIVE